MTETEILGRLSQIRMSATGKVPFGPVDDLRDLKNECDSDFTSKKNFENAINERREDAFWGEYIQMAFRQP